MTRALVMALRDFGPLMEVTPSLWLTDEEDWLRRADQRERQAQQEQERNALRDRAIAYLLERCKVYGVEFVAEDAEAMALRLVGEERILGLRKAEPWHEFNGFNCNDFGDRDCKGWDGESRRCQCGNRRVSWEIEGTFENPRVYCEAYLCPAAPRPRPPCPARSASPCSSRSAMTGARSCCWASSTSPARTAIAPRPW